MSREPLQPGRDEHYERHEASWICGDAEFGNACPLGPLHHGLCSRQHDCQPIKTQDRWQCTRPGSQGGACEPGPLPDGQCGQPRRNCVPRIALRYRRSAIVIGTVALTLGLLTILLNGPQRSHFISPGPLTQHHAALVGRTSDSTTGCAACHAAAVQSPTEWLHGLLRPEPGNQVAQSDLCLTCHREHLSDNALFAHSVAPASLERLTRAIPSEVHTDRERTSELAVEPLSSTRWTARSDPTNRDRELACATCHREHQGADVDLTEMTNQECRNCHHRPFDDFVQHHPEFRNWPAPRNRHIAFDHGSHLRQHFPASQQTFHCATCHSMEGGDMVAVEGYASCAACHDPKIKSGLQEGLTLVSLPCLEPEFLGWTTDEMPWPATSTGSFDGPISPLMMLLLLGDASVQDILVRYGVDFDFFDLDTEDQQNMADAGAIAQAIRRLCGELSEDAGESLSQRFTVALGKRPTPDTIDQLLQGLDTKRVAQCVTDWFPPLAPQQAENQRVDDPRPALPAGSSGDVLLTIPAARGGSDFGDATSHTSIRHQAADRLATAASNDNFRGGWQVDTVTNRLFYRPTQHADPIMRQLIEFSLDRNERAHPLARELLGKLRSSHEAQQCFSCHAVGSSRPNWSAASSKTQAMFTKFKHGPHLIQTELRDCQYCHAARLADVHAVKADGSSDFAAISKSACASCHHQRAAGQQCTQCHNYHAADALLVPRGPLAVKHRATTR